MIKGNPCIVTQFATAKPGKHGAAKALITGKDIFTKKAYSASYKTTENYPAPIVMKEEFACLEVMEDGFMILQN